MNPQRSVPPRLQMITLCEALTWIAFRRAVTWDQFQSLKKGEPERFPQRDMETAKTQLKDRAAAGLLTIYARRINPELDELERLKQAPSQLTPEAFLIPVMELHESGELCPSTYNDFPEDNEPFIWLDAFTDLTLRAWEVLALWRDTGHAITPETNNPPENLVSQVWELPDKMPPGLLKHPRTHEAFQTMCRYADNFLRERGGPPTRDDIVGQAKGYPIHKGRKLYQLMPSRLRNPARTGY